ncbi:xanthine dehydrogenase family protein subunit M [Rhodoplanes sp. TEM]|uniref:Xanthine dehydrogenase family protein subunit M n=1 Tax=Rhodoplanes tepidamans TaxID=200616 RepID=A0ABT5JBV1_RHOTP|nr:MULTISPECIES: xanthine dehydrogenase family protein subunit M [Rhodoplanes]MDC7787149.1 xanthine dehydrogenase family protein subunit M [Rhodoplanes tepidamans]MDC7984287.1 xanthine dehydrogenase family protein subunit M [Rhodoplanes sp. TEM]MDQ0356084.1 carbon-monoxide dehydrogenase medium subunit [Rhodoplanes tepidamans]
MKPPPFDYACPTSLAEAIDLIARHDGDAKPIAGGQSLMPMLAFRLAAPTLLVDLRRVPGLDGITVDDDGVMLGARVRWCDIEADARLAAACPLLAAAIPHVAHYQIRNRGTVGGSLAHADPAAELPAVALACAAEIVAQGPEGRRTIAADDFLVGPLTTALEPTELIVAVRFPPWPAGRHHGFAEFSRRKGDFAIVGVALFFDDADGAIAGATVVAFGIGDRPQRLAAAEEVLNGAAPSAELFARAAAAAADSVEPQTDIHADGDYRRALLATLLERTLAQSAGLASAS